MTPSTAAAKLLAIAEERLDGSATSKLRGLLAAGDLNGSVHDGIALVVDCFERHLKGNLTEYYGGWRGLTWWVPSLDTLAQMMIDSGFAEVKVHVVYSLPFVNELSGPWRAALVATT